MARVTETWTAKLFYGFGTVAYGVKDNAFQVFLLYYYTLIQGLPAVTVGTALLIAVLIDAVTDPLVGQFSDNLRTRFGRRHPLMFAAALPVSVSFYFLWVPPAGLSENDLFWYLLMCASLTRIFTTFYEIPSSSMNAELTQDYHQRVQFASFRYFFAWFGGAGISIYALATYFRDSSAFPNGLENPAGYESYALLGAILMFTSMLVSAGGTVRYVPHLITDASEKLQGFGALMQNLVNVVADRVFAPLFGTAVMFSMGLGVSISLNLFFHTYFWNFSSQEMVTLGLAVLVGALLAPLLAPFATRGELDKRRAAIRLGLIAALLIPMPVLLRLLGLFPENGDPMLLPLIFAQLVTVIGLGVAAEILITAMVADVVEDNERRTGRKSAGVFFAARAFATKSTNGLGVFVGSTIVAAAGLEKGMSRDAATPEMVATLGQLYVPVIASIYLVAVLMLTQFKVTRERHEENLAALESEDRQPPAL